MLRDPEVQQLLAENGIRNLAAKFSDVAVRFDLAGLREIWTPDAVWEIGPPLPARAAGIDAIVEMMKQLRPAFELFVQLTHSGTIEIAGDRARSRWIVQEVGRNENTHRNYNNYALYVDDLVRLDGRWLYKQRRYDYLWVDLETHLPGRSFALPDEVTNPLKLR